MKTRAATVVAAIGLIALSAAAAAPARTHDRLPHSALVPNAVAFLDRRHGLVGTGWEGCVNKARHCRLQGTISLTSDGGKTWRVVLHIRRPVVAVAYFHDALFARTDRGQTYWADASARRWRRRTPLSFKGYCPEGWNAGISAELVDTNIVVPWSICVGLRGGGNEAKAVYRGKKRVAFTPTALHRGYGGISEYGYAAGIAGAHDRFGIIWETRGTLYVTRDGGRNWHGLPKVARPEIDFGYWADVGAYPRGTGFVLLSIGGGEKRRLIETRDAGRTWRVVHRWR
jgi:hypothetical protein